MPRRKACIDQSLLGSIEPKKKSLSFPTRNGSAKFSRNIGNVRCAPRSPTVRQAEIIGVQPRSFERFGWIVTREGPVIFVPPDLVTI